MCMCMGPSWGIIDWWRRREEDEEEKGVGTIDEAMLFPSFLFFFFTPLLLSFSSLRYAPLWPLFVHFLLLLFAVPRSGGMHGTADAQLVILATAFVLLSLVIITITIIIIIIVKRVLCLHTRCFLLQFPPSALWGLLVVSGCHAFFEFENPGLD